VTGGDPAEPQRVDMRQLAEETVKVTIDITELLRAGTITREEHDRLIELAKTDTRSHAFSVISVLAMIAVALGAIGLFPEFFTTLGTKLLDIFGARGLHFIAILATGAGALAAGSAFLSMLCAFAVLTFVGNAGLFYSHAEYLIAIEEPKLTVLVFSALAWVVYWASLHLDAKRARVAVVFSRTCIFFVNLAFWVGSLWGDRSAANPKSSEIVFSIVWALALVAVGTWAATRDKRWVVNTVAVFSAIHFYTQWFEHLGANPGSLVMAGVLALGIVAALRRYNRNMQAPITA